MKRNLTIMLILLVSLNCIFAFPAYGDKDYDNGYRDGLEAKQSEWDNWCEEAYNSGDIIERNDADNFIKYAFAIGLISGYEAKKDNADLVGVDSYLSGHEYDEAIDMILQQFSLGDNDGFIEHMWDLFDEVYPKIIAGH